jgi:hypothetical protein
MDLMYFVSLFCGRTQRSIKDKLYICTKTYTIKIHVFMEKRIVTFGEIMLRLATPDYLRFNQSDKLSATFGGGKRM